MKIQITTTISVRFPTGMTLPKLESKASPKASFVVLASNNLDVLRRDVAVLEAAIKADYRSADNIHAQGYGYAGELLV